MPPANFSTAEDGKFHGADRMTASSAAPESTRVVDADLRERGRTAALRCACYAAWSELMASPHDVDPRESLADRIGAGSALEYGAGLDALIEEYLQRDPGEMKREYSRLFEVGSDGPPVPIREDLQTGQHAGTREDLVRFYDFFGYALAENFAWQPDHLSVELEFMHFLCYHESAASADEQSFQLAQVDFAQRHLLNWLGRACDGVQTLAPGSLHARILDELQRFVVADVAWQRATICELPEAP